MPTSSELLVFFSKGDSLLVVEALHKVLQVYKLQLAVLEWTYILSCVYDMSIPAANNINA